METAARTIEAPRIELRKKRMPRTRADFRLAAIWLAQHAAKAGNALSACLAGPCADDEDNGICLGYRDGRDQPWPKKKEEERA